MGCHNTLYVIHVSSEQAAPSDAKLLQQTNWLMVSVRRPPLTDFLECCLIGMFHTKPKPLNPCLTVQM